MSKQFFPVGLKVYIRPTTCTQAIPAVRDQFPVRKAFFQSTKLERIEIRPSSSWRTFTQNSWNLPSWISCFGALRTGKPSRTTGKRFFSGRRTHINLQTNWKKPFDHWKNSLNSSMWNFTVHLGYPALDQLAESEIWNFRKVGNLDPGHLIQILIVEK